MTKKKRQKLFYALTAAFLLLGTAIVFYAQGWRLDTTSFKLKKVGAIFVRSYPESAKIYLDGKMVKNDSGIFQNGTLINNLFPKNYQIKLSAEGYYPWQENISVSPSMVAEAKYAVLVPTQISPAATGTISNFWIFGDNILFQNQKNKLLLGNSTIGSGNVLGFTNDFNDILTFDPNTLLYVRHEPDSGANLNINQALKKIRYDLKKLNSVYIDPESRSKLILLEAKKLLSFDPEKSALLKLGAAGAGEEFGSVIASSKFYLSWTKFNPSSNSSTIEIYDKFLQDSREKKFELPGKNISLAWLKNNKLAALQNDGFLYLYDIAENIPRKIADGAKSFALTGDGGKIATLGNGGLQIFSFTQEENYQRFNLPRINSVNKIFWYADTNHLFVQYPDYVAFLDIADSALHNFTTVVETGLSKYDAQQNVLYFIKGGKLFSIEFPK